MSIEEILDRDRAALLFMYGSVPEHIIDGLLGTGAHVLLAKRLDMLMDVGILLFTLAQPWSPAIE